MQSLEIIIPEKSKKVEKYIDRYSNWWLVLVDYIGYGLRYEEYQHLNKSNLPNSNFDKLIIINPLNHSDYFSLEL